MGARFPRIRLYGATELAKRLIRRAKVELLRTKEVAAKMGVRTYGRLTPLSDTSWIRTDISPAGEEIAIYAAGEEVIPQKKIPEKRLLIPRCTPGIFFYQHAWADGTTYMFPVADIQLNAPNVLLGDEPITKRDLAGELVSYSGGEWRRMGLGVSTNPDFGQSFNGGWWGLKSAEGLVNPYRRCRVLTYGGHPSNFSDVSTFRTAIQPTLDNLVDPNIRSTTALPITTLYKRCWLHGVHFLVERYVLGACILKEEVEGVERDFLYFIYQRFPGEQFPWIEHVININFTRPAGGPADVVARIPVNEFSVTDGLISENSYFTDPTHLHEDVWTVPYSTYGDAHGTSIWKDNHAFPRTPFFVDESGVAYAMRLYWDSTNSIHRHKILSINMRTGAHSVEDDTDTLPIFTWDCARSPREVLTRGATSIGGTRFDLTPPVPWHRDWTASISNATSKGKLVTLFSGLDKRYEYRLIVDGSSTMNDDQSISGFTETPYRGGDTFGLPIAGGIPDDATAYTTTETRTVTASENLYIDLVCYEENTEIARLRICEFAYTDSSSEIIAEYPIIDWAFSNAGIAGYTGGCSGTEIVYNPPVAQPPPNAAFYGTGFQTAYICANITRSHNVVSTAIIRIPIFHHPKNPNGWYYVEREVNTTEVEDEEACVQDIVLRVVMNGVVTEERQETINGRAYAPSFYPPGYAFARWESYSNGPFLHLADGGVLPQSSSWYSGILDSTTDHIEEPLYTWGTRGTGMNPDLQDAVISFFDFPNPNFANTGYSFMQAFLVAAEFCESAEVHLHPVQLLRHSQPFLHKTNPSGANYYRFYCPDYAAAHYPVNNTDGWVFVAQIRNVHIFTPGQKPLGAWIWENAFTCNNYDSVLDDVHPGAWYSYPIGNASAMAIAAGLGYPQDGYHDVTFVSNTFALPEVQAILSAGTGITYEAGDNYVAGIGIT